MRFNSRFLFPTMALSATLVACGGSEEVIEDRDVEDATDTAEGDAIGGDTTVTDTAEPDDVAVEVVEDVTEEVIEPDIVEDTNDAALDVSCEPGFELVDTECVDIDECSLETDTCDENATCSNTEGSFSCECVVGYEGDGTTCSDVDECDAGTDTCDADAECTNTPGAFECACDEGFEGDGFECTPAACDPTCGDAAECVVVEGTPTCQCPVGFEGDPLEGCADINECEGPTVTFEKTDIDEDTLVDCLTDSVCIGRSSTGGPIFNSVAGETGGRATCGGVDGETGELRAPDVVVSGAEWAFGSCNTPGLEFVTFLDENFAGCQPPSIVDQPACVHVLEEDVYFDITFTNWGDGETGPGAFAYTRTEFTGACGIGATCANTEGSFECTCFDGYEGDAVVGCDDIDECADAPCGADTCINGPGTFGCSCETVSFARPIGSVEEDCISGDVCIARGSSFPIYNSLVEESASARCDSSPIPSGTLWSDEPCALSSSDDFGPFLSGSFADCSPPDIVGVDGCLLVVASDEYHDIRFTEWGSGSSGGGAFAYERTRFAVEAACE